METETAANKKQGGRRAELNRSRRLCRECGLCCFAEEDVGFHAEVDNDELVLLPKRYSNLAKKVEQEFGTLALPTVEHYNGPGACVAFKGRLFSNCTCDIYAQRPHVCRVLKPEGKTCLAIRQAYFSR
jgi:Fe-S-cluster containining protein